MKHLIFYLGLGTLFTHELDAMVNHEWRLLPWINSLTDETGMVVFIFLHVPLCAALICMVASTKDKIRTFSRWGISLFLIVHAILHTVFMGNDLYEFASWVSNVLIFGGALLGALFLHLEYRSRQRVAT